MRTYFPKSILHFHYLSVLLTGIVKFIDLLNLKVVNGNKNRSTLGILKERNFFQIEFYCVTNIFKVLYPFIW